MPKVTLLSSLSCATCGDAWLERLAQLFEQVSLGSALSGDELGIIFVQLCNVLEPRVAVAFSSASLELWGQTQALRQQLRTEHEAAAVLCLKLAIRDGDTSETGYDSPFPPRNCKELREAKFILCELMTPQPTYDNNLTAADLTKLGTLGSVLPALQTLELYLDQPVQGLVEGLGAGALPALTRLVLQMHVGDAGASALAAALGRGALPRLDTLELGNAAIGDAGLVALAPALRRLPALKHLELYGNPLGDEGIAALVAPPLLAGALSLSTGGLTMLESLDLNQTQITDASCATLAAALNRGALPALEELYLGGTAADFTAAKQFLSAVHKALKDSRRHLLSTESAAHRET